MSSRHERSTKERSPSIEPGRAPASATLRALEEGRDLVTFDLSGRTAAEHLELAAAATGRSFRVLEHGETQEIGRCSDEYVDTGDVYREIVRDAVLREGSETAAPEPTPAGVLERLLTRNAGALKSRRPVVVLLPASAAK